MNSQAKGYIVMIQRNKMKRVSTFNKKQKAIVKDAIQLGRGVYYFPDKDYYPHDMPEKVSERYPYLNITAEAMVRDLVRLAVEHGVPQEDIHCFKAEPAQIPMDEFVRKKLNESYEWELKEKPKKSEAN